MVGKLGPHFLDLSLDDFRALLAGRRGAIKTFLLDQSRVAGIGNVYVQDPLWKARVHPLRPIHTLTDEEVEALHQALRRNLQDSIDQGGFAYEQNLPTGVRRATGTASRWAIGRDIPARAAARWLSRSRPGAPRAISARRASGSRHQTSLARSWFRPSLTAWNDELIRFAAEP